MNRLLTVSRAARLVGVSRGTLQKQIQDGELQSFEGMVDVDELNTAYPQAQLEDNTMLEKIEEIIDNALKRARGDKLRKLLAPDLSTLAARVSSLSKEMSRLKAENIQLRSVLEQTVASLQQWQSKPDAKVPAELQKQINQVLNAPASETEATHLSIQDAVLRIVAAQVHLMPSGHEFFVEGNSSILEAGLSAGLAMNYGCSNGNCGKCKAKLISGEVKQIHQHDYIFPDLEKSQGYILSCSNTAISDVVLHAEEAGSENDIPLQKITARVKRVEKVNDDLALLQLRTPRTQRLRFLAGQRAALSPQGFEATEYHIASCPCDDMNLQFHICRDAKNPFSEHVFHHIQASESITIEGPRGHFVLYEDGRRPLIFLAFNTGFAPIKSLIEHAMTLDANEFSHLYWFHPSPGKPYLHNLARTWNDAFDNFRYTPLPLAQDSDKAALNALLETISQDYPDLSQFDVYACGTQLEMDQVGDYFTHRGVPQNQLMTEVL